MHSSQKYKPRLNNPGGVVDFPMTDDFQVTADMQKVFDWDGVMKVSNFLSTEEVTKLTHMLENTPEITDRAWDLPDGEGRACRLVIWNQPGDDLTGMVARSEKCVKTCQALLGGEVYHYYSKVTMSNAKTGGKNLWHQAYGYWYKNGNLRPDMMTVNIALDKSTKDSGCLQVIKGTHRCGRIEHNLMHGQTVADQERIDELCKHHEHVPAELNPGDALFFHCNVLQTSGRNVSDKRHWAFLVSYNRADNNPVYVHHHGPYTPIKMVPNSAIMDCTNLTDLSGKDFMDPAGDKTTRATPADSVTH